MFVLHLDGAFDHIAENTAQAAAMARDAFDFNEATDAELYDQDGALIAQWFADDKESN